MTREIVHRDDGIVDGFYQSTFFWAGEEIVSRVDRQLVELHYVPDLRFKEGMRALHEKRVPAGTPIVDHRGYAVGEVPSSADIDET